MQTQAYADSMIRQRVDLPVIYGDVENGFSKFVLIKSFLCGDTERAASIGITFGRREKLAAGIAAGTLACKTAFYRVGLRLPVSDRVDARLNRRIVALLDMYGHADFVTDADQYNLT